MPTAGGATAGYCAIGSEWIAITPAMLSPSASTQAKIGRSMKNLAMARGSGLRHLRRALAHIAAARDDIWLCRAGEIANHAALVLPSP